MMRYTDIKAKIVEDVISEKQYYTLKESLVQSYLLMDKLNQQEIKKLLLNVFNMSEQELMERSTSFHQYRMKKSIITATIEVAEKWIEKSNMKDVPSLLELTHSNVEINGPKGAISGSHHLEGWLERANLRLSTINRFAKQHDIVLEQEGIWYEDNDEVRGKAIVYTYMKIIEDKVSLIARYDNKREAFQMSGLSEEDIIN